MELAIYNNALLRFSGTVGGGTPILDLGKNSLQGDHIVAIRGILNGTTNYILSRMLNESISKDAALKEAQLVGYAEADPTIDVEGFDSAAKLVILANYVLERPISIKDVDVTGINNVTLEDIQQEKEKKCVVKLLATISDNEASVRPQLLPKEHPLNVDGVLNAVTFSTDSAGDITITGKGAGGYETAGAIIRDLINIQHTS
jgi:homoserine dehydrogenase